MHRLKGVLCCVFKVSGSVLKRILKLTLYEVLWVCSVSLILFTYWAWTSQTVNKDNTSLKNPILLWWTSGFPGTTGTLFCQDVNCDIFTRNEVKVPNVDAFLFYASNIDFEDLPLPRKLNDIWGLYHEESPRNVEELMHENGLRLFNYSATFSRYSDVQFPLQYLESLDDITTTKYFVKTKDKNDLLKDISPILYLQTDCETATERDEYVKELMKHIEIDSYGACLNNKEMPKRFTDDYLNNLNDDDFLHFIARYKFVIAIENGVCDDYITEKFWRAIKVGSVPIYFGSPTVRDWFPNERSAILIEDHPTPQRMSEYLNRLIKDDDLYNLYLIHKTDKEINNQRLIEEYNSKPWQRDHILAANKFECFVCRRVHEMRQKVLPPQIINKSHYNCPKPISALNLQVNPTNDWVYSWHRAKERAEEIYRRVENDKN